MAKLRYFVEKTASPPSAFTSDAWNSSSLMGIALLLAWLSQLEAIPTLCAMLHCSHECFRKPTTHHCISVPSPTITRLLFNPLFVLIRRPGWVCPIGRQPLPNGGPNAIGPLGVLSKTNSSALMRSKSLLRCAGALLTCCRYLRYLRSLT